MKAKPKKQKKKTSASKKKPPKTKPSTSSTTNDSVLQNDKPKESAEPKTDKPATQDEKRHQRKRHRKRPKATMLQTLRKFSAGKVKIPKERSQWAKKMADTHLEYIRKYCKEKAPQFFSHLVYTGSFYEHLKTEDANEIDIILALDTKSDAHLTIEEVTLPGYAQIKATKRSSKYWKEFANGEGYIRPQKMRSFFFGLVQKAVTKYKEEQTTEDKKKLELKVSDNGPAIKLVIKDKPNKMEMSVDLVPAFLFKEKKVVGAAHAVGKHYVAKIPPKELASKHKLQGCKLLWRRSFSLDEKKKMQDLDKDNRSCRREVIKIIKTIRTNDATLAKLSSFHIKTAFLHYNFGEGKEKLDWSGEELPDRFYELMKYLLECVKAKQLKHFFIPELNLLEELPDTTLENIDGRLTKLIENENELRKVVFVEPTANPNASNTTKDLKPTAKKRKLDH